jgi:predicted ATP-dependent protease
MRYSYAVTGAVGQYGEMQPIGGVNTKIEGFWELCRQRRAGGEQAEGGYGVLIPAVNTRDLMLRDDVAEAIIREGWFHIWPINTVDEALAILTGLSAAEIAARVEQRLQRFHEMGAQGRAAR